MWRGWNRSRTRGHDLGHCHQELSIILFTQLLWFGMHCVENWNQKKNRRESEVTTGDVERIHQSACVILWNNVLPFLSVSCSHRECKNFYHIHFWQFGNTSPSSWLNPNCLRKCFKSIRKTNGGSQDKLRRSEEIQNCKFCINRQGKSED